MARYVDLGTFHGFSFRDQCALPGEYTADQVIEWDHDKQGEAEFWPSGDTAITYAVFEHKSSVTASEITQLTELLEELDESDHVKLIYAMAEGYSLDQLDANQIQDLCCYVFEGNSFCDLYKDAGWELFETFHPELAKAVNEANCSGVHFDPEDYLNNDCSTTELEFEGSKYLIVNV
jgi:hypothetical protein